MGGFAKLIPAFNYVGDIKMFVSKKENESEYDKLLYCNSFLEAHNWKTLLGHFRSLPEHSLNAASSGNCSRNVFSPLVRKGNQTKQSFYRTLQTSVPVKEM